MKDLADHWTVAINTLNNDPSPSNERAEAAACTAYMDELAEIRNAPICTNEDLAEKTRICLFNDRYFNGADWDFVDKLSEDLA